MRIALGLEYRGASFCGWQSQPRQCGVQDAVNAALGKVAGEKITVVAAGRTDAAVHATLQIVHFDAPSARPSAAWVRGANVELPNDIAVLWAKKVGDDFHARHSAVARRYQYVLLNRPAPPALLRQLCGFCGVPLNVAAMQRAADKLVGEHDFSVFRAASCQAKTAVRSLHRVSVCRKNELVVFDFCGNGFLQKMVRNLVGALLEIGKGRRPPQWVEELLLCKDRAQSADTATAGGLYFCGAAYPPRFGLPQRYRAAPPVAMIKLPTTPK